MHMLYSSLNLLKVAHYSFLRLNSERYHCLLDVSILNGACKNDARNPKKKRKLLQHLKGVKSLRYT